MKKRLFSAILAFLIMTLSAISCSQAEDETETNPETAPQETEKETHFH